MLTFKTAKTTAATLAAALVVVVGASSAAGAGTSAPATPFVQAAAQQFKAQPRPTGPVRPIAPRRTIVQHGGTADNASHGCHDYASQTSYEGPCDYHPEYESTGGCESSAEQASLPGNCPNSSEP